MRVRYFIEYALEQDEDDGHHFYRPIGVWARGDGPWELTILYLPDAEMRWFATQLYICAFMERGDAHFPDDLLEQWIEHVPLYTGDCSPIYDTEARNAEDVAQHLLTTMMTKQPLHNPPYRRASP